MTPTVFFAVLLAAALHAGWNAIAKQGQDKYLTMAAVVLGHIPWALAAISMSPIPNIESWPYLLAGATLHCGYQFALLTAFRTGALSTVYPISRGVAPILVVVILFVIWGETLSSSQILAVSMIGIAALSILSAREDENSLNPKTIVASLATAGFIAAYSIIDGLGARLSGTAWGFYGWLAIVNAGMFATVHSIRHPRTVPTVLALHKRTALLGGLASFAAYSIVVWAFTQAPVALVAALRESSIAFAFCIGVLVLNERVNARKVASTALTLFGVILLRIAR